MAAIDCLIEDPQPILDEAGILSVDPLPLTRGTTQESRLRPAMWRTEFEGASYMALVPGMLKDPFKKNRRLLPPKWRKEFLDELLHCLTAGQHQIWCGFQSSLAQALRFRPRAAIAEARGRPRSPYRPHFVVLRTYKARYSLPNASSTWLRSGSPMATRPTPDRPSKNSSTSSA